MNLLGGLQQDAAKKLGAHAFFTDWGATTPRPIGVLYEQLFDVQSKIALAVGQIGIVTLLLTVSGKASNANRQKPYFEQIRVVARTYENVLINRANSGTRQPASVVAEASALILHGYKPCGLSASLFCTDITLVDHPKLLVFDAAFTIQAGMTDAEPVRVVPPSIS